MPQSIPEHFLKGSVPDKMSIQRSWVFYLRIHITSGNNCGKFQVSRKICSRETTCFLHAPIEKALKTGTSEKSIGATQLCLKRRRTWTLWPNKTSLKSFCREMNALSPGYNTFDKCFADTELLSVFVKGPICTFPFWGVPTSEVTTRCSFKFFFFF
jgi:hypothetical protein